MLQGILADCWTSMLGQQQSLHHQVTIYDNVNIRLLLQAFFLLFCAIQFVITDWHLKVSSKIETESLIYFLYTCCLCLGYLDRKFFGVQNFFLPNQRFFLNFFIYYHNKTAYTCLISIYSNKLKYKRTCFSIRIRPLNILWMKTNKKV